MRMENKSFLVLAGVVWIASCAAAEDGSVLLPQTGSVIESSDNKVSKDESTLLPGTRWKYSFDVFMVSTLTGSGTVNATLKRPCGWPLGGMMCWDMDVNQDFQNTQNLTAGVRLGMWKTDGDEIAYGLGGEVFPLALEANYVSQSALVIALVGMVKLPSLWKESGWRLDPYLGLSIGPLLSSSMTVSYPGMTHPVSGSASGGMGSMLFGISKQISPTRSIFMEGRMTSFSMDYPERTAQITVITGDSAYITLVTKQVMFGLSNSF